MSPATTSPSLSVIGPVLMNRSVSRSPGARAKSPGPPESPAAPRVDRAALFQARSTPAGAPGSPGSPAVLPDSAPAPGAAFPQPAAPGALMAVLDASRYAEAAHRLHRRPDAAGSPWISYSLAVAARLGRAGAAEPLLLQAALLADVVTFAKDQFRALAELRARFGDPVARVVAELTEDRSVSKAERRAAQIEVAPTLSPVARTVALARLAENLEALAAGVPESWTAERVQEHFAWASEFAAALADGQLPIPAMHLAAELKPVLAGSVKLSDGTAVPALPEPEGYAQGTSRAIGGGTLAWVAR